MGCVSSFDVGGCGCVGGSCTTTISGAIIGCNSLGLPSVSVEAHDATAGGTLLATTTTDASGNYTFSGISAVSGNAIIIVPVPGTRFVVVNRTLSWTSGASPTTTQWGCGKTTATASAVQTVASGYHCWSIVFACAYPVADTLHLTDSFFGSFTVVNSGSGWIFPTVSYSYPGCFGCTAGTITVSFSSLQWHWKGDVAGCPNDAASNNCNTASGGTTTCYIPGVSAFNVSVNWDAHGNACLNSLFCTSVSSPQTTTLTE